MNENPRLMCEECAKWISYSTYHKYNGYCLKCYHKVGECVCED